jgi:hypothetical protein
MESETVVKAIINRLIHYNNKYKVLICKEY